MLGRICRTDGRRMTLEQGEILGLPVAVLSLPEKAERKPRKLLKGARTLAERRVTRVLAPSDFPGWPALQRLGLRQVDTEALRCALTPAWVRAGLEQKGVPARRAVLTLRGERESFSMLRVARALSPMVRGVVVDTVCAGELPQVLRREFGMPVYPPGSVQSDLVLTFEPGPVLEGSKFFLPGVDVPEDCAPLPLLCALWEAGRIRAEEIQVSVR